MHNSVFMQTGSLVINIGSLKHPHKINTNQQICNSFSKVQSTFIRFKGKIIDRDEAIGEFDIQYLRDEVERRLVGSNLTTHDK